MLQRPGMAHGEALSQMGSDESGLPSVGHFKPCVAHWSTCHCALPLNRINWVTHFQPSCSRVQLTQLLTGPMEGCPGKTLKVWKHKTGKDISEWLNEILVDTCLKKRQRMVSAERKEDRSQRQHQNKGLAHLWNLG